MKTLLCTTAIMLAATQGIAGGLSNPVIPADPAPQTQSGSGGLYVLGGIGGDNFDAGYSSSDVFLDEPWKKHGMHSVLVDDSADISGSNGTATVELGYLVPMGDFIVGASLDYTAFNFGGESVCQEDAGLADNPKWPRPDHTCHAALDSAVSASLIGGYQFSDKFMLLASVGLAQAQGSQGWEGKIERQTVTRVSDEDFTVDGITYAVQARYAMTDQWGVGLEAQAFDFDTVDTEHEYGNTHTDFDVVNVSAFVSFNF